MAFLFATVTTAVLLIEPVGDTMDDASIAANFVQLFRCLIDVDPSNSCLGVELSSDPSRWKPKCLIVMRCDSDDLSLTSIMRATWVIDEAGLHRPTDSPLPRGSFTNAFHRTSPYVKFSTIQETVHYGVNLGDNWYRCYKAPIDSFGTGESTIENVFDSATDSAARKRAEP